MTQNAKPVVAIVGRPNVGKSTMFNRLVGRRTAIVSEEAGTTRDRVMAETVWADRVFILVDTGGLDIGAQTEMGQNVRRQVEIAVQDADIIVMLVDASAGVIATDRDVADALRAADKPVILAANKADNEQREIAALEFHELGMGPPIPVSAYHNVGVDDLMAQVIAGFPSGPQYEEPDADLRLAIVGRTNVGKSLLLNAITGQERAIVSESPGTTRDAVDSLVAYEDKSILIIDTAGIRRSGKVDPGIEHYSVLRAMMAIDRADVAVLVLDASELATNQDTHIGGYILDKYKGIVIVVNKWDLAPELGLSETLAEQVVKDRFRFASFAPICFTSGLAASGITGLIDTALGVYSEWTKDLPRYGLRRTVMTAVAEHPPATTGKRSLKIYGVAQDRTRPPTFTFYVNRSEMVHFSYQRYLENTLREAYDFKGSPLKMRFRGRGER